MTSYLITFRGKDGKTDQVLIEANDVQQAIWDKVHQIPDKPMKIEFDPKSGS